MTTSTRSPIPLTETGDAVASKDEMANEYYNLSGWMRDLRAVLTDNNDKAHTMLQHVRDLMEELLDNSILTEYDEEDDGSEDDEELLQQDADPDLGVPGRRDRGAARPGNAGRAPRSLRQLGGTAPLDDALPRDVQAKRQRDRERPARNVARTKRPVKRGKVKK